MRLKVRLVYEVYSELVAEFVPVALIRIMTCSHRIYVEALYNPDVLEKFLLFECSSVHAGKLMAVNSLENYSLSVDTHDAVLHLKTSETDALRNVLDEFTVLVVYGNIEKIKIRNFSTPCKHLRYLSLKMHVFLYSKSHSHENALSRLIDEFISYCSADISLNIKLTVKCSRRVIIL